MTKKIFVDTSAWFSLLDKDSENHQEAVQYLKETEIPFITSDYVMDETLTLIRSAISHKAAIEFWGNLNKSRWATIIDVSTNDKEHAIEIFKKYHDKDFSFTDCTSFALMQRLGIKEAFSFDRHFRQIGFITIP